jgi:GNAT superfamily N-acetyltransferase
MIEIMTVFDPGEELVDPLERGLHEFNLAHLGEAVIYNYHKLAVIAHDDSGEIIGGVWGHLVWDWLHIQTLWVKDTRRGEGIGRQLLNTIERAAVSKGFTRSHLETTDFQALDFYKKNGYEIFGELEGKPRGHTWYYIKKDLAESS